MIRECPLPRSSNGARVAMRKEYPCTDYHPDKSRQGKQDCKDSLYHDVTSTVFRVPHPLSRRVSSATTRSGRSRVMWINPYKGAMANVASLPAHPMSGCCTSM